MRRNHEDEMKLLVQYVHWRRLTDGLVTSPGRKPEFSGEMCGEFRTLLESQVLTTTEHGGEWRELGVTARFEDEGVVLGLLREAFRDLDRRRVLDSEGKLLRGRVEGSLQLAGGV